jgi:hypothetical protein
MVSNPSKRITSFVGFIAIAPLSPKLKAAEFGVQNEAKIPHIRGRSQTQNLHISDFASATHEH